MEWSQTSINWVKLDEKLCKGKYLYACKRPDDFGPNAPLPWAWVYIMDKPVKAAGREIIETYKFTEYDPLALSATIYAMREKYSDQSRSD